jgi:hypothetical protein
MLVARDSPSSSPDDALYGFVVAKGDRTGGP